MSTNCATIPHEISPAALHYIAAPKEDGMSKNGWKSSSRLSDTPAASPTNDNTNSSIHDDSSAICNIANTSITTVSLAAKIKALKSKFHLDRGLLVKHLPRNVAKHEIAQLLHEFAVDSIQLSGADDKSGTATVMLEKPEVLDEWNSERTFLLRGQSVSVSPTPTEMVLCVARLPFHYAESDFYELVKAFGEVKMHFLMVSEKTGVSKGYGFVQYASKESALAARNGLNNRIIGDSFQLVCDWLDSSRVTFRSLHSTCLYVDRLPRQFRDMSEFRAIFEKIVKPPYCQIALRNGCPLDWGLVEYLSPDDAELAQTSCNHYRLRNQPIRVVYFIPGVRAITLMLSLLETPSRGKSGGGLLPDPTGQSIRMSIENLSKQNPIFAENLKNIILHQIQESKQGPMKGGRDETSLPSKTVTTTSATTAVTGKVGLEPNTLDIPLKATSVAMASLPLHSHNSKDIEKIIPPTPPMTPTIVNTLPIMSPVAAAAGIPASATMPMLPNTAIPPPSVEKVAAYAAAAAAAVPQTQLSMSLKDKYSVMWTDFLGQTTTTPPPPSFAATVNGFLPAAAVQPATADAAAAAAAAATFGVHPISANFAQEIVNLPLNVQQNILNIINNSSAAVVASAQPQPVPPPSAAAVATPSISFSPLTATVDPTTNWLLQQQQKAPPSVNGTSLVSTPLGPSIVTVPVVSKAAVLQNWATVGSFMPTPGTIPVFTSSGAEWQNVRMHPHIVAAVSQPSTPTSHHLPHQPHYYMAGQKRKLLPSPEKSPEGNYIGQHSQGIGGHYADSYFKKKKMF